MVPGTSVANVTFGVCLAATLVWRLRAQREGADFLGPFRRMSPLHGPIAAFVGLSILSCFFSTLPSRSLLELKGFGTFFLLALTMGFLDDAADVHLLLDAWRITALYMVLRGLFEYLAGSDNLDARPTGGMSVYMTYAGLLMIFVLLLAGRGLSRVQGAAARGADLVIAAAGALAVGLTLTRSAYLGLGFGAAALLCISRPKLTLVLPLLAALSFFLMPAAVKDRAISSFDPNDLTMRDRLVMWRAGAAMIGDRPFFGVGPGRVKELYPVYRRPGFVNPHPGHLHDNMVMVAAETGIPSLLAYLAFVAAFFVHAARRARGFRLAPHLSVVRGAIAAMAALFVAGLFEYNFGDVEVLMATLVTAALPFALPSETPGPAAPL